MSGAAIRTEALTRRFGSLVAVDAIEYEVPVGAVSALIGPNGAGKTTLLSMLCGWLKPSKGGGDVLGARLGDTSALKGRLGVYPQDASLQPRRKVVHQLALWGELSGMGRDEALSSARSSLSRVGLADKADHPAGTLSHGMARRAGIAAALLGKPDLLLLDEPTAGLDPRAAHDVREILAGLRGTATVVVSSHNLSELQSICSHATILDHGRIVAQGSLDELTRAGAEVCIQLAQSARDPDLASLRQLARVRAVELTKGVLTVRFDASEEVPVEEPLAEVLKALLGSGSLVAEVRRGRSLEQRFLELTGGASRS